MADLWCLLERTRISIVPVLVFVLTLYLPWMQRIYAQNMPQIEVDMEGYNIGNNCVEGQTVIFYCDITGISSVSQYEVNWTKGVRVSQSTGVTLVQLDSKRVAYSTWHNDDNSVTYTLRLENATINDSGVYTCQIFFRYYASHGSMAWSSAQESEDVTVRKVTRKLPQCKSLRSRGSSPSADINSNTFYVGELVRFSCQSRVGVTLSWLRQNVDRTQELLPEMDITNNEIETHFYTFTAEDEVNGAIYVCRQFNIDTGQLEGNCIMGPVHVVPAPTFLPTTTMTPPPTPTVPSTTTIVKPTTLAQLPMLISWKDGMVGKYNNTEPEVKESVSKVCPQYGYILVPTFIAIISVIINFYLLAKLRAAKQAKVDKMCENRHCGTRFRTGTLDKDEYCSCGYMLKIAQHESEV